VALSFTMEKSTAVHSREIMDVFVADISSVRVIKPPSGVMTCLERLCNRDFIMPNASGRGRRLQKKRKREQEERCLEEVP
jgi:hypothetical protein